MTRLLIGIALLAALAAPAAAGPRKGPAAEEIQVSVAGGDGTLRAQAERALAPYVRGPAGRPVRRRSTDELVLAVTDAIFGPQAARPGDFTPSAQNRQSVIETVREYVEAGKPIEGVTFWVGRKNYGVTGSGEPDLGDALAIRRYEAINQAVKAAGYAPGIKARIVLEDLGQLVMGGNTASVRRGISTYEKGMGRLIDVIGPNVSYELESSIISRRPVPDHVARLLGLEPGTRGSSKVFLRLAALVEERAFAYLQASARIAPATAADEAGLARVRSLPELHALEATGFKGALPQDMRAAITRSTLERIGNPKGLSQTELDRAIARDLSQSFSRALMGLRSGSTRVDGRTLAPLTFSWVPYPSGSPPSLDVRRIEWTPNNQKGKGSPPPWAGSAVFAPRGKRITTAMDAYSARGRTRSSVPLEVTFKRAGKSVTVRSELRRQRAAAPRRAAADSPLEMDVKMGAPVRGARFATEPGEIRRALKSYLGRPARPTSRPASREALVDAVVEALFGPVADRPGASPPENRASVVATVREFIRAGKPIEGVTYWDGARLGQRTSAKAELVDALAIARLAELDARVKAAGYAPGVKVRVVLEDLGRRVMSGDSKRVRSRVETYTHGLEKLIRVVGPNVVLERESALITRPMPEQATRLLGLPPGAAGTEKEYFRLTRIIERKLLAYLIESEGREPAHPDDQRGFARVRELRTYAALEAIGFKGGLPTTQRAALRQRTRERNGDRRLGGRELDVQVARYLAQGFARTVLDARRGATAGPGGAPIAPLAFSLLPHPPGSPPELYRRRIELKTIRGKRAPSTRPWLANGVFAPRGGRLAVTSDPVSRHGKAKQRQPVYITLRRDREQITVRGDLRRLRAGRGAARRSTTARSRARH